MELKTISKIKWITGILAILFIFWSFINPYYVRPLGITGCIFAIISLISVLIQDKIEYEIERDDKDE